MPYRYSVLSMDFLLHLSSIPRHKVSGQIKGFAFIEYSTPEEAKAAVEVRLSL